MNKNKQNLYLIKRFHPYFELFYFRHGKAVWSSKLSILIVWRGECFAAILEIFKEEITQFLHEYVPNNIL